MDLSFLRELAWRQWEPTELHHNVSILKQDGIDIAVKYDAAHCNWPWYRSLTIRIGNTTVLFRLPRQDQEHHPVAPLCLDCPDGPLTDTVVEELRKVVLKLISRHF